MKTIVASHNPDLARDFDRDLLRRRDLRLVTARTTADLLDRLRAGADLCFLDRMLPDGDSATALQAIRDEKKLANIPVVMVTASGAPASDRAQALEEAGAPESAALRDYLRVLVSGRPFHWQVADENGRQVVALHGVLRADSDIEPLKSLRGEVWFRLREFRRISSDSVQRWIEL